ncbi:MAG: hypothetical protein HY848_13035 [Betaproteobacteria bacterium]|nr:hypothetical protein [Betaproteobacteria bacterium]
MRADVLFIRAQSAIRADGTPSAQARSLRLDVSYYADRCRRSGHCALARANPVFGTDEKRIRTENRVMQLLRNNCRIRANVFVILVAASGRAMDKNKAVLWVAFIQDRRLRADVLFIRAQSTIRADDFSSAQYCNSGTSGGTRFRLPRMKTKKSRFSANCVNT